jgi:hypothetical protein
MLPYGCLLIDLLIDFTSQVAAALRLDFAGIEIDRFLAKI